MAKQEFRRVLTKFKNLAYLFVGRSGTICEFWTDNVDKVALGLEAEPQAQQQQMRQIAEENEAIQRRNEELKARLARLEQQMQQMTEQVLEYPPTEDNGPASADRKPVTKPTSGGEEDSKLRSEGLPAYVMLVAMLLALAAGVLVWRYAPALRGRGG